MKKLFCKENLIELAKISMFTIIGLCIYQSLLQLIPTDSFCDNGLYEQTENAISTAREKLVKLATALCPLALIVIGVLALITHDERKMAVYQKLAITIIVVFALILLVNSGVVIDAVKEFVDGSSGHTTSSTGGATGINHPQIGGRNTTYR